MYFACLCFSKYCPDLNGLSGVVDERVVKASLDLKRQVIAVISLQTGKKELHTGISEYVTHPGFGNRVPSGLRKISRYIRTDTLRLKVITLKHLPSSRLA
jgi:hypothetical protein